MYLVTADEMQRMDRATIESFGIPGRVLMENAGRGATAFFLETVHRNHPGAVGIVAGRGNNGGDGFVMARYLHQKGIRATVFLLSEKDRVKGDAAANLKLLDTMGVPVVELADAAAFESRKSLMRRQHTWIDAILGTGLSSEVKGYFRTVIDFINRQARPVFAVDIASGLNSDTGRVCGACIQAAATATFGFAKVGHLCYPGRTLSGHIENHRHRYPATPRRQDRLPAAPHHARGPEERNPSAIGNGPQRPHRPPVDPGRFSRENRRRRLDRRGCHARGSGFGDPGDTQIARPGAGIHGHGSHDRRNARNGGRCSG